MEITKIEMKGTSKWMRHPYKWTQDVTWEKTKLEGEAYAMHYFFLTKFKYKETSTHYGDAIDIVAWMVATESYTSIMLQYPTTTLLYSTTKQ